MAAILSEPQYVEGGSNRQDIPRNIYPEANSTYGKISTLNKKAFTVAQWVLMKTHTSSTLHKWWMMYIRSGVKLEISQGLSECGLNS